MSGISTDFNIAIENDPFVDDLPIQHDYFPCVKLLSLLLLCSPGRQTRTEVRQNSSNCTKGQDIRNVRMPENRMSADYTIYMPYIYILYIYSLYNMLSLGSYGERERERCQKKIRQMDSCDPLQDEAAVGL